MCVKDAALYLDLMRDSYEGYVIYLFLALMIAYLGDGSEERVVEVRAYLGPTLSSGSRLHRQRLTSSRSHVVFSEQLLRSLPPMAHPFPFSKWCAPLELGAAFIRDCKLATIQFVVLKPLMSFVAIVLEVNGVYNQGSFSPASGYLYTSLVVNASITYAFYYLVLFYLALGPALAPFNPVPKFLCIKAVLFLSFWQSVVLAFLSRFELIHEVGSWSVENVTTGINNLLICFEMSVVALAHHRAFPYRPYVVATDATATGASSAGRRSVLADHLAFGDAVRDFNEVMPVVLPTHFTPGASILKAKKNLTQVAARDVFAVSEHARLLTAQHDAADEKSDPGATKRGWKM